MAFALAPVLSGLASLVAVPAVTARFGPSGWAAIAIGMSVGAGAAVLGELGWSLDGPARAARLSGRTRTLFALALATKLWVLPVTIVASGAVAAALARDYAIEAAVMGASTALLGLSMSWYFIGRGNPGAVLLTDTAPRLLAATVAACLLSLGSPLIVYPLLVALAGIAAPLLAARRVGLRAEEMRAFSRSSVQRAIRAQSTALRGRAASATYIALPVALVGIVAPSSVATFAAAERLQRMVLALLQFLPNTMLRWVSRPPDKRERQRRAVVSVVTSVGLGLVAAGVWVILAPLAAVVVFAGEITLSTEIVGLTAAVIAISTVSRATGIALVAQRATHAVSNSAMAGAAVGVSGIIVFSAALGAEGGMIGEVLAEAMVLTWQVTALVLVAKRSSAK